MSRAESPKLLASASIKLRLATVSGLVLLIGALLSPRAAPIPIPPLAERSAPLIEEQVQRPPTPPLFGGVDALAERLRQHGVSVQAAAPATPATVSDFAETRTATTETGHGVFLSDRFILTHAAALGGRSSVNLATASGAAISARVVAYDPSTALALLEAPPVAGASNPTHAGNPPRPGALVVAVGIAAGRNLATPLFVTSVLRDRFLTGAASPAGAPVYDLSGALLGISAGPDSGGQVFGAAESAGRLIARATDGEETASFGLALQDLDESLARVFGSRGALISDVLQGGPASRSGVVAGDLLLAMGGVEMTSAVEAARALAMAPAGQPTALTIARRGRQRVVDVTPASAYDMAALAREAGPAPPTVEARLLFPRDVLDASAIPPTARVVSVNGAPAAIRGVPVRVPRSSRPTVVALEHHGTRYLAVVETPR